MKPSDFSPVRQQAVVVTEHRVPTVSLSRAEAESTDLLPPSAFVVENPQSAQVPAGHSTEFTKSIRCGDYDLSPFNSH